MCREMFDKHWSLLEATLATFIPEAVTVVREPAIAMMRDIARAGYVGQCRTSVTQDDYTYVVGDQSFEDLLARECRAQFLPGILTRTSRKKAETKYFLFVQ